ncbi:sugar nucleotide-binding protein [Clostridium tyrobutyricum]|uniref:dTDP-4-dehydrorhamnose reductase n=1 Tax=Clostridium tyrobutyricum DIVETGP TaxID=1408889 RepID=W6N4Y5_CLOTY|nr:SDR family oxidoreductase [Clostridium tyrobutyricum]AND85380.1 dTDP-4-dehydrorhamnose reductase [Clostridium tyrobutyricum]ANP69928.1 hypothetical protein BA182_09625 [Clostridium tyrobutyricum]MBV4433982.1 SDR family oxidoreductase [Clostridium tyrobutyricum]QNB65710.1 sugar nucleotide-binding protein [Clostridium tyrobutyricum]CDL91653.1 dTDP-4-dehydrorhamnose reductase [Clostridium tyrobutyricum DIVETGP]
MKNILIVGASGFLGNELYKIFKKDSSYKTYGTYSKNENSNLLYLDVTDIESIKKVFEKIKPNIIIITAALTNVEYCEESKENVYKINVEGIKNISNISKPYNCKVIYISTEYVFDGKNGPYSEIDEVNPINYYGKTKLSGEKVIQTYIRNYMIVRTTVVYGWNLESKNFIMQLIKNLNENKIMKVPVDQISSPTYCPNLASMIKESCDNNLCGVFNIVGKDVMNRYEFAVKSAEVLNLDKNLLVPVKTENLGQIAKRPLNAGLKIDKIYKKLKCKPVNVHDGLIEIKELYDKYKSNNCEDNSYE